MLFLKLNLQLTVKMVNVFMLLFEFTITKKAPFEAFSDQQETVSCSSSIRFQVAYSAFSSSPAFRLAESEMEAKIEIEGEIFDTVSTPTIASILL
jgi:hypothetical protein